MRLHWQQARGQAHGDGLSERRLSHTSVKPDDMVEDRGPHTRVKQRGCTLPSPSAGNLAWLEHTMIIRCGWMMAEDMVHRDMQKAEIDV